MALTFDFTRYGQELAIARVSAPHTNLLHGSFVKAPPPGGGLVGATRRSFRWEVVCVIAQKDDAIYSWRGEHRFRSEDIDSYLTQSSCVQKSSGNPPEKLFQQQTKYITASGK